MQSRLACPEWAMLEVARPTTEPDVSIELSEPATIFEEVLPRRDGDALSFSVKSTGRWDIANGTRVTITPDPIAQGHVLRLFTLGSAWAAIGYQRGWAMLHGAAVKIGDTAVLLGGAQERGKSTLAAAMTRHGHILLADDLVRVDPPGEGGRAMVQPAVPRLKLWQAALEHLGMQGNVIARDHFRQEKFHLAIEQGHCFGPIPLGAIVLLEWGGKTALTRLSGAEAVGAVLAACTFRPEMLAVMGLEVEQAALMARIVASTHVYRLNRPRDFARIEESCGLLGTVAGNCQAISG